MLAIYKIRCTDCSLIFIMQTKNTVRNKFKIAVDTLKKMLYVNNIK